MEPTPPGDRPRSVATAALLYRTALGLLPAGFRRRFGDEATADVEAAAVEAHRRGGAVAVAGVLARALVDLVLRAPRERRALNVDGRGEGIVEGTRRELKAAVRALARRPGFTAVAGFTLSLGIGATVAIASVVWAILLRPLPFHDADRLVALDHHAPGLDLPTMNSSEGMIRLYRDLSRTLEGLAVLRSDARTFAGSDRPERVDVLLASPSAFRVLGVEPARGRAFTEEDAREGAPAVAVLTDAGWRSRFGADPGVVGRSVRLDGVPTEVVGVMPPSFTYPDRETVALLPLFVDPDGPFGEFGLPVVARLAPGVELEAARREIEVLQSRIPERFGDIDGTFLERAGWSATLVPFRERVVEEDVRTALWVVLGTVGFVLLIACANVANLFLVRAEGRRKEVAVRAAMGAGRGRLAIGFVSEAMVLALGAGAVGVALAWLGVDALVAHGPRELPRLHEVAVDLPVLLFALGLSLAAGLVLGSFPVLRVLGRSFAGILRDGGRGSTDGRERHRLRNVLVATQVAMALVLLVGSGLMLRTFQGLRSVDAGFRPEGVLVVAASLPDGVERSEAADFFLRAAERVRALPGVEAAAAANSLPLRPMEMNGSSFSIESRPREDDELPPVTMFQVVTPDYFRTLGVRLLDGRAPTRADQEDGAPVTWVSRSFADRFLDGDAVGERIRVGTQPDSSWHEIVGVVADVKTQSLAEPVRPMAYFLLGDVCCSAATAALVVRTPGEPTSLVPAVRNALAGVDPSVPVTASLTMEEVVRRSMVRTSFTLVLLGIAGLVALVLGAVGIYGVIAYVVGRRTREIGVRMALGAAAGDVRGMVLRQGMAVVALGLAVGLAGAAALSRLMTSLLFEVEAVDPATYAGVTVALAAVAAFASWIPARRASRVDPVEALSQE